ncbi:Saccharopine dehydrogenase-domain-containing protein [Aspergillus cavernicola]|uniref:Saccharopine dehydrogenase-domain-containing protein n=1 Tax=Aspergillus cavernicola TaxID=176166 RepID=A0ABR4HHK8_9EURO
MYDIVVFGATGYTGRLCASFIAQNYPTTVQWGIAGRSETKLKDLAKELQRDFPDRVQPETELVELDIESLTPLVSKSKVVINGVGPFHRFSTPIVEACARLGVHYVDFTTETLWIKGLIEKYEDVARESGAILIPGISPTAPADLIAWLITKQIRDSFSTGPSEVIATGKLDIKAMSAGSLTTVLDSLATYGPSWYLSGNPWILSPSSQKPKSTPSPPLLTRLFGYRSAPGLGGLSTSFTGPGNSSIVHRSASQNPNLYGPTFHYSEYLPAASITSAFLIHLVTKLAVLMISIPLIRGLLRRKLVPSDNAAVPDQEELRRLERAEYCAVGRVETYGEKPVARALFVREGALYEFTALLTCAGARVLLNEERGEERRGKGGFFTPSLLGMEYVEGLRDGGVRIEVQDLTVDV